MSAMTDSTPESRAQYTDEQIRAAVSEAIRETGWREDQLLWELAAHKLDPDGGAVEAVLRWAAT